jgi:hypothetical protein
MEFSCVTKCYFKDGHFALLFLLGTTTFLANSVHGVLLFFIINKYSEQTDKRTSYVVRHTGPTLEKYVGTCSGPLAVTVGGVAV